MKQIIGNQDRERNSKVDTEKWKEHKEYYSNLKNIKKHEKTQQQENLERTVLEYDSKGILYFNSEGEPRIKIAPIEKMNVHTATQSDYDKLMIIYECAGWKWKSNDPPTNINYWKSNYKSKTIISAYKQHTELGQQIFFVDSLDINKVGHPNISFKEFQETLGITPQMLIELNEWYDTHKPDRASKG